MKRICFIGTLICAILLFCVTAYSFSSPAASIPRDNTSLSMTHDLSPPELGNCTANNTTFSGTAPPVFDYNTEMAATTIADNISLTSAITNSPPTTQCSDITAITMTISGFERAGPQTSTLSNVPTSYTMWTEDSPTNMEGAMGISPPIVRNDYPNPFNANNAPPTREVRFNYIGNLIIDV